MNDGFKQEKNTNKILENAQACMDGPKSLKQNLTESKFWSIYIKTWCTIIYSESTCDLTPLERLIQVVLTLYQYCLWYLNDTVSTLAW